MKLNGLTECVVVLRVIDSQREIEWSDCIIACGGCVTGNRATLEKFSDKNQQEDINF